MFLLIFIETQYLEDTEDADHDESILISVMSIHEFWYFPTEVHYKDEEEKYRDHKCTTMSPSPFTECWVVRLEVFLLEDSESTDESDKKQSEYTRLWYPTDHLWCCLRESLLEHLECCEEDDEESYPLDAGIAFEKLRDIARSDNHENDGYDETDHEIYHVSMARSCYSQDIIEAHSDIGDDDRLYGSHECISSLGSLFMMFIRSYLTVELPYHIEEEECSEELEPWNLEEKYDSKWEYDTENCRSCHSPEYCPFPFYSLELLRRHTDEDSIISAHDEVDEDDIKQGECSCRSEEVSEVRRESIEHSEES